LIADSRWPIEEVAVMRKAFVLSFGLVLYLAASAFGQAMVDGTEYLDMLGLPSEGGWAIPYIATPPTLDGDISDEEWAPSLYYEFGPSTLEMWAEIHGWGANEPGNRGSDGIRGQLKQSEIEDANEAETDADFYYNVWLAWDTDNLYVAVEATDNIYDPLGDQDGAYWSRDGYFLEFDMENKRSGGTGDGGPGIIAVDFSAVPKDEQPGSIIWWTAGTPDSPNRLYGVEPETFMGIDDGVAVTDIGWNLEAKIPWDFLYQQVTKPAIQEGVEFPMAWICPDPDGEDGFGGQFWHGRGGLSDDLSTWSVYKLVGGPKTAVKSTTWGAVKALF
jgi:hypothetical protein